MDEQRDLQKDFEVPLSLQKIMMIIFSTEKGLSKSLPAELTILLAASLLA